MFWNFATSSNIDAILEKEDVTLTEVMDDDDVLQECKGKNTKLVEFLSRLNNMEDLVSFVIAEPPSDADEAVKYKYPNIACELLTSDVPQINDMLGDTKSLQEKLFSFLDIATVVNPLLASFFSKVVGILLSRKPESTLEYIKTKNGFLGSVLKHLGTSAIMDLLLRLITCVESADLRSQVLSWLNEEKLIERLIGLIDPSVDDDFHCNSAQSLCDIIRLSREHMYTMQESAQEDPLLNTLERKETIELLLQHMFDKEITESVVINGVSVLLALLEIRRPAPFGFPEMAPELTQLDVERLANGVSKTLHGISNRLTDFHKLLEDPPQKRVMHCTFGELDPPLGNTRLHVGKLLSAILITNTHNMNVQLSELQIFNALLDLFFQYEYNNFLHTQVVQCIQTVLSNTVTVTSPLTRSSVYSNDNESRCVEENPKEEEENPRKVAPLLTHLFEDCRIVQRILDAWEDNRVRETEASGHRKGNMGHLTLICNQIVENMDKGANAERIRHFIVGLPEDDQGRWHKFLTESLCEINEKNSRELGGHNPMHFSSDDDGEPDYRDVPFSSNSAQQAFTDFQLQQITSTFIDQFGFADGDFTEKDHTDDRFNKINSIDFHIKADTNSPNHELFEGICRARLPNFGDGGGEEDNEDMFLYGKEGDDDWDITNNATVDSPFKQESETLVITVRSQTSLGGSDGSSSSEASDSMKPPPLTTSSDAEQQDSDWRTAPSEENSSSEGRDTNSSGYSTHILASSNATYEASSWAPELGSSAPLMKQEDNWANFENMDILSSDQTEGKVCEMESTLMSVSSLNDGSTNKDVASLQCIESKDQPRDGGAMGVFASDAVFKRFRSSEESDVVMNVDADSSNASQETEHRLCSTDQTLSCERSHPAEVTLMETNDASSSSTETSVQVSPPIQEEQRLLGDCKIDPDEAQSLSEVGSLTPKSSEILPCRSDSLAIRTEPFEAINNKLPASGGTDNLVDVAPVHSSFLSRADGDGALDNTTDNPVSSIGDNAMVSTKSNSEFQNSEVTSSTVSSQLKINGPL